MAPERFLASEESLRSARHWITTCGTSHILCATTSQDTFVPTRLLRIEHDSAHLVEVFAEKCVKWAALTYVWGGEQSFKTTISSLTAMKRKFPIQYLPQTLQDACTVCRGLDIKYLWVDCLCIIQDDAEDLAKELVEMPRIYQRAWITISASTATTVKQGFLYDRGITRKQAETTLISLPFSSSDKLTMGGILLNAAICDSPYSSLPISRRAWTFQERNLSPRILDFGHCSITYRCRTGNHNIDGEMHWHDYIGVTLYPNDIPWLPTQDLPDWRYTVHEYSTRVLTFPKDKLNAIAALADMYSARTKQTYVAGLWKEDLVAHLASNTVPPVGHGPQSISTKRFSSDIRCHVRIIRKKRWF
jgi:hypothetical protein